MDFLPALLNGMPTVCSLCFRGLCGKDFLTEAEQQTKKRGKKKDGDDADVKKSSRVLRKLASRQKDRVLDATLDDQFASGRLLACISSRPGQSGRADGYILEGSELAFYKKKLDVKKDKKH